MDACLFDGDDKWGCVGVGIALSQQSGVVVGDQQANQCKSDNIEERDAPKDLFDCAWERLARVRSLCGSKTNQLGACKCKSGSDEDAAEPFEAVVEGPWVDPVLAANVSSVGGAAAV